MTPDEAKEKLAFVRGVLALLLDTGLFGPLLDRAAEELDSVASSLEEPVAERRAG